jgi:hypothetical protein
MEHPTSPRLPPSPSGLWRTSRRAGWSARLRSRLSRRRPGEAHAATSSASYVGFCPVIVGLGGVLVGSQSDAENMPSLRAAAKQSHGAEGIASSPSGRRSPRNDESGPGAFGGPWVRTFDSPPSVSLGANTPCGDTRSRGFGCARVQGAMPGTRLGIASADCEVMFADAVGTAQLLLERVNGEHHVRPVRVWSSYAVRA